MTTAEIAFTNNQQSGLEELAGASPVAVNVVADGTGAIHRRPGIAQASVGGQGVIDANGISGIYATVKGLVYAVGGAGTPVIFGSNTDRHIYRLVATGARDLSPTGDYDKLTGTGRPVFAETEALLAIAGGERPQKVLFLNDESSRLANAPRCSHIAANASRLIANDVGDYQGQVHWSDLAGGSSYAGHEVWNVGIGTAGFVTAEARPDPVVALHENSNELLLFGTTSLQLWGPDGSTVYAPITTKEFGIAAPHSVIKASSMFGWIDHARRIVLSDGRSQTIISDPIKATLDSYSDLSGAYGFRVFTGYVDAFVWVMPDGRGFCYQVGGGWSLWQGGGILCHAQVPGTNENLVGLQSGKVGRLVCDEPTDLGAPIESYVITGFDNRKTYARKHCQCVRIVLRRGPTAGNGDKLIVSYRDEPGPWSSPIPVDIDAYGDSSPVVELRSLGTYRTRQWKFEFRGSSKLSLVSAAEEFEIGEQ